jgi:Scavenger mRNA decapping enzyme (DcpS) N-terminal
MLEKLKQFKVGQVIKREPTGASVAFLGSFEEEKESKVVLALKKREFPETIDLKECDSLTETLNNDIFHKFIFSLHSPSVNLVRLLKCY